MSESEHPTPSPLKPPSPIEAETNAAYEKMGEVLGKIGRERIITVAERLRETGDRRNLNALTRGYSKVPYSTGNPGTKVTPLQLVPEQKKASGE